MTENTFNENECVDALALGTAMFGFYLSLADNPIHGVGLELAKLFKLGDWDNRTVGFVLLNSKLAVAASYFSRSGLVGHALALLYEDRVQRAPHRPSTLLHLCGNRLWTGEHNYRQATARTLDAHR